jgi:hypothetical protein
VLKDLLCAGHLARIFERKKNPPPKDWKEVLDADSLPESRGNRCGDEVRKYTVKLSNAKNWRFAARHRSVWMKKNRGGHGEETG